MPMTLTVTVTVAVTMETWIARQTGAPQANLQTARVLISRALSIALGRKRTRERAAAPMGQGQTRALVR